MGDDVKHIPSWAWQPKKTGAHLLVRTSSSDQKPRRVRIDEKPGYLLGRNAATVDIHCTSNKKTSRVHAALVHDADGRVHLLDLKSVHGTSCHTSL